MALSARSKTLRRPWLSRGHGIALGAAIFLALLGLELRLATPQAHPSAPASTPSKSASVAPRLVSHAPTTPVFGRLQSLR
jgi:hypothetical protein